MWDIGKQFMRNGRLWKVVYTDSDGVFLRPYLGAGMWFGGDWYPFDLAAELFVADEFSQPWTEADENGALTIHQTERP